MTYENSKRLYDFYVESGNESAAANLLAKYPEFGDLAVEEQPEEPEEEKPKKGKK